MVLQLKEPSHARWLNTALHPGHWSGLQQAGGGELEGDRAHSALLGGGVHFAQAFDRLVQCIARGSRNGLLGQHTSLHDNVMQLQSMQILLTGGKVGLLDALAQHVRRHNVDDL